MNVLVVVLIPLAAIVLLFRTLVLQPYDTPSSSMAPTLAVGDQFMVAKFAYGYSRYSLPFSPALFSGRFFGAQPQYGDVVAFRLKDGVTDYIKRVVGLPGDRVQMRDGVLHINGRPVQREEIESDDDTCERWRERLPNGVTYDTFDCAKDGFYDSTREYVVPPGHYFMMGDNRDNSTDSRVMAAVGYVPYENLIGRFAFTYASGTGDE